METTIAVFFRNVHLNEKLLHSPQLVKSCPFHSLLHCHKRVYKSLSKQFTYNSGEKDKESCGNLEWVPVAQ